MITLDELGQLLGHKCKPKSIRTFCHDSRKIKLDDIYIALKGERVDGHDYVLHAEKAGAIAAIVERRCSSAKIPQFIVENCVQTWHKIACHIRAKSSATIIGITGSCGKTTVKSLLGHVLSSQGTTLETFGNLNNEIGVPLTLSQLNKYHEYAVIEMGARNKGDIKVLCECVLPDIGIITCAHKVHMDSFATLNDVIETKAELFQTMKQGVAVFPKGDRGSEFWSKGSKHLSTRVVSLSSPYTLEFISYSNNRMKIKIIDGNGASHFLNSQLLGKFNLNNISLVLSVTFELGIALNEVIDALQTFIPVNSRQQIFNLNKISLIDDSYNANPTSVKASMDTLIELTNFPVFILGDMVELGRNTQDLHREVAKHARSLGICLYYFGDHRDAVADGYGSYQGIFSEYSDLIKSLNFLGNESVWVKGSRKSRMERVVNHIRRIY